MFTCFFRPLPGLLVLLLPISACGQVSEPPLPEWNEASTPLPADMLAPEAGSLPEPTAEPVDLPPAEHMPELPPLGAPQDGEAAPELPEIPGLAKPQQAPPRAKPLEENGGNRLEVAEAQLLRWFPSPRQARAESIKTGKPMLFVIAGFGWSPACQALNNDVLMSGQFKKIAGENFVLTFLNVPTRGNVSDERKRRQFEAIQKFRSFLHVRSLPTMLLFDGEGHEIDRMVGYNFNRNLRPAAFARAIDRMQRVAEHEAKLRRDKEKRRAMLAETQHYRMWTSDVGSTLFAKAVRLTSVPLPTEENLEATEPAVLLMDEFGKPRTVPLRKLVIEDREIARRESAPQ